LIAFWIDTNTHISDSFVFLTRVFNYTLYRFKIEFLKTSFEKTEFFDLEKNFYKI